MLDAKTKEFLTKSADYLTSDKHACCFASKANVIDWLQQFTPQLENVSAESAGLLTVAVVGEFKAGKSTLINAILGKEVAFVDAFEATTSVAVIKPGSNEVVRVEYSGGNRKVMSIAEFVKACAQYKMRDAKYVEIIVNHNWPFVLIDTPGMGSINTAHEERAETAIMDLADLVLWIMDPSDMLSAKESAFLKRARSINLPIWCIVSKTDQLSDAEIEDCIECVARTTGLDKSSIIALSAKNYMESKSDQGVTELLDRLMLMSRRSNDVRDQAKSAKTAELLDEFKHAVELMANCVKSEIEWLDGEREVFDQEARLVESSLCMEAKSILLGSVKTFFTNRLVPLVNSGAQPNEICRILIESFLKERLPSVANRIASEAHDKAVAVWDASFEERRADLSRQIENIIRNEMQSSDSERFLRDQLVVTEERREAVMHGFKATPAVIGAGALTLLIDPTGITANLVTMAIGALAGHIAGLSAKDASVRCVTETKIDAEAVANYALQMSDTIIDQLVMPKIADYLNHVVDQALDKRCSQRLSGMSTNDVRTVYAELNQILCGLNNITFSESSEDYMPNQFGSSVDKTTASVGDTQNSYAYKARDALVYVVNEYGLGICQSPRQVEALLKDLCGDCSKEIFLLAECLACDAVDRLITQRDLVPAQALILAVAEEFHKSRLIELDAARWAVECWNEALKGASCSNFSKTARQDW